jgi:hypothetical protein
MDLKNRTQKKTNPNHGGHGGEEKGGHRLWKIFATTGEKVVKVMSINRAAFSEYKKGSDQKYHNVIRDVPTHSTKKATRRGDPMYLPPRGSP